MALFRRGGAEPEQVPADPVPPGRPAGGPARKDRPTPSRREAEAARRERVHRTLTPREARRLSAQQNRSARLKAMASRDAAPEKVLMRDFVDSRFNLGEFLLPSLLVILASTFFTSVLPQLAWVTTVAMYLFILSVLVDSYLMWRRFKGLLATRLPDAPTRGLAMYGINRAIQIRRFRIPAPRVKRGEKI